VLIALGVRRAFGSGFQRCFASQRPLVFMHVPKSAGTALAAGLQAALLPNTVLAGFDASLFGTFSDYSGIAEPIRRLIHLPPAALPGDVQMVAGHFAFSGLRRAYRRGRFMTLLREPVCRLLSLWLFWRQHDDSMLAPWGRWGDHVRLSRQPLARFLRSPLVACQTDNQVLRQLLWPHPLIPDGGFIDPSHDRILVRQARQRLSRFGFVDAIENPGFSQRLEEWLGCPVPTERLNETSAIPDSLRRPLDSELTPEARELLTMRSRLDLELWHGVMQDRMPDTDIAAIRENTRARTLARYAALMAPRSPVLEPTGG
jgi:hypothetical protein